MAKADSISPAVDHKMVDEVLSKILEKAQYTEKLLEVALSKLPTDSDSHLIEATVISACRFNDELQIAVCDLMEKNDLALTKQLPGAGSEGGAA